MSAFNLRTECPVCGEILITSGIVTTTTSGYQFTCPHCDLWIIREAKEHTLRMLTATGCKNLEPLTDNDAVNLRWALENYAAAWVELNEVSS